MAMWQFYVQMLIISAGILLPILIALFKNKQYLISKSKKFLYKTSLDAFLISLGISIFLELIFYLTLTFGPPVGEGGMIVVIWPIYSLFYMLGITLFVFLVSFSMFYWKNRS